MQKFGLQVISFIRKSRKYHSYKDNVDKVALNRTHRRFHTHILHQKITMDTTEFKYYEVDDKERMIIKKLYLDPFMDMCNGEIISFNISQQPSAMGIMTALKAAINITFDYPYRRTFHSDRGWAYQMNAYVYEIKESSYISKYVS